MENNYATPASGLKRTFVQIVESPGLRTLAKAGLRVAPRRIQSWLKQQRLKVKIRDGFALVPSTRLMETYRAALRWLMAQDDGAIGDYLEFGVFYGNSLMCMHRVLDELGLRQVRLFGFDSWQGLPEDARTDDHGLWKPGDFKMDFESARSYLTGEGVDWSRVHLEQGWFNDTLRPEFIARHQITKASVIMVDCDLYSSARQALDFCAPLIGRHAVMLFDDWGAGDLAEKNLGEKRALSEFLASHPGIQVEETDTYIETAKVFRVRNSAPAAINTTASVPAVA